MRTVILLQHLGPLFASSPVARLIRSTCLRQWKLLSLNLTTSLLEAAGEGASLAVVFLAVQVLGSTGSVNWQTNPLISQSRHLVMWLNGVPRTPLFLVLLLLALLLQLGLSIIRYINSLSSGYFSARCTRLITAQLHSQILDLSYPCASHYRVGDLTDIAGGGPGAVGQVLSYYNQLIINLLLISVYLVILFSLSPWLVLIVVAMAAVLLMVQRQLLPLIRRSAHRVSAAQMEISVRLTEDIQGLRFLHSSGQLADAKMRMASRMEELEQSLRRRFQQTELIGPISAFMPMLAIASIGAGSVLAFGTKTSGVLPSLVTFVLALQRLNARISSTASVFTYLTSLSGILSRVNDLLGTTDKQFVRKGGKIFTGLNHSIELRDVNLRYLQDSPEALHQINLVLNKGTTTALVGPSGSGKSSIADLLVGLYQPSQGQILVDGHDLACLDLSSWQRHLGVVSQDTFLFNATIAENITHGISDVTADDIASACSAAQCLEFILALPDGFETLVGERGYRLSGGQRQRLSLARALLRQPDLLILDEATSALDSNNERLIQNAISQLHNQSTILIIAHRLSTIVNADQILVLQEGAVLQHGTHTSLMASEGLYRELWQEQSKQSDIDPLSGAWNRRQILAMLERFVQQCRRYSMPLTLAVIDLQLADAETGSRVPVGHQIAHHLTQALRQRLRDTDALGSLDAQRLLLVMPHTSLADAQKVTIELQALLNDRALSQTIDPTILLTATVGVSQWLDGDTAVEMLFRAELGLQGHVLGSEAKGHQR